MAAEIGDAAIIAAMAASSSITAVVETIKDAGLPSKFARLACLVVGTALGAAAGALVNVDSQQIALGAGGGFISGIAAMASYAAVKGSVEKRVAAAAATPGKGY